MCSLTSNFDFTFLNLSEWYSRSASFTIYMSGVRQDTEFQRTVKWPMSPHKNPVSMERSMYSLSCSIYGIITMVCAERTLLRQGLSTSCLAKTQLGGHPLAYTSSVERALDE